VAGTARWSLLKSMWRLLVNLSKGGLRLNFSCLWWWSCCNSVKSALPTAKIADGWMSMTIRVCVSGLDRLFANRNGFDYLDCIHSMMLRKLLDEWEVSVRNMLHIPHYVSLCIYQGIDECGYHLICITLFCFKIPCFVAFSCNVRTNVDLVFRFSKCQSRLSSVPGSRHSLTNPRLGFVTPVWSLELGNRWLIPVCHFYSRHCTYTLGSTEYSTRRVSEELIAKSIRDETNQSSYDGLG
jgi:hypothetical protein